MITRIINHKGNQISELLVSTNPLKDYNIGKTDLFQIKTDDNISLNARLIKPYDFDENKRYPVLIYVYNGPGVQLIRNNWLASSPLWMYYLANQDYIDDSFDATKLPGSQVTGISTYIPRDMTNFPISNKTGKKSTTFNFQRATLIDSFVNSFEIFS